MISVREVIEATGGTIVSEGEMFAAGISIDSRTIKEGELFIPLKGERYDGHDFLKDALKKACGTLLNRDAQCVTEGRLTMKELHIADCDTVKTVILVDDTLRALQDLARHIRKRFKGHVIGVIGSNGKTTTKELISSILGTRLKVLKTAGNYNNHIGMPLSVANAEKDTDVMVLEMGTNRPGDIEELCGIAFPDIGVVTNIGYEHIEGFGSLEKVRDSELEILPYVKKLVLNADDSFLMEGAVKKFKGEMLRFGIENPEAELNVREIVFTDEGANYLLCYAGERVGIESKLPGRFNIYNSLAAASAATALGFALQEIKIGLESFGGIAMRFEIIKSKGVTFLNDSYNANPSSMEESLNELSRRVAYEKGIGKSPIRAVAVLGDMLELGDYADEAHRQLGRLLSQLPVEIFIGVGPLMSAAVSEFKGRGVRAATSDEAGIELAKTMREGDIVLIKGSRGMRMERVLHAAASEREM